MTFKMASQQQDGCGRHSLFRTLADLKITSVTSQYQAIKELRNGQPGVFCKNLFLKDRAGTFYLIIVHEDALVDIKSLKRNLQACRSLSFASQEDLSFILCVIPGAVSPFALLNAREKQTPLRIIIDKDLIDKQQFLNFHPLTSEETTAVSYPSLSKFVHYCGYEVEELSVKSL